MNKPEQEGRPPGPASAHSTVRQAKVPLQVSLPPVALPLEEAQSLRSGVVVDLGVALAHAVVEVRLGSRRIGQGTLVLVGEHAGVRLRLTE